MDAMMRFLEPGIHLMMMPFGFERDECVPAFVGFNALLWVEYGVLWGLAFRFRPGYKLINSPAGVRTRDRWREQYSLFRRSEEWVERKVGSISRSRLVRPLTNFFGVKASDVIMASAETTVVYNVLALPVLIPTNIYSLKRYFATRKEHQQHRARN